MSHLRPAAQVQPALVLPSRWAPGLAGLLLLLLLLLLLEVLLLVPLLMVLLLRGLHPFLMPLFVAWSCAARRGSACHASLSPCTMQCGTEYAGISKKETAAFGICKTHACIVAPRKTCSRHRTKQAFHETLDESSIPERPCRPS